MFESAETTNELIIDIEDCLNDIMGEIQEQNLNININEIRNNIKNIKLELKKLNEV